MKAALCVGALRGPASKRFPDQTILGLLGSLMAVGVPLALAAAPQSNVVAIVGAPGSGMTELAQLVASADGAILAGGGARSIVIARSDAEGFVGRLYGAGARLVVDARLARACGRNPQDTTAATPRPASGISAP